MWHKSGSIPEWIHVLILHLYAFVNHNIMGYSSGVIFRVSRGFASRLFLPSILSKKIFFLCIWHKFDKNDVKRKAIFAAKSRCITSYASILDFYVYISDILFLFRLRNSKLLHFCSSEHIFICWERERERERETYS